MSSITNAGITYIMGTMFAMLASLVVCDTGLCHMTIQIYNSEHSGAVVSEICSLSVTSMAALERHQKAKHSNRTFCCAECGVSKEC